MGEKVGRAKAENSLQLLVNPIQQKMTDATVHLLNAKAYINEFSSQDELKENCVYLLENLNFLPDEHGFVEAFVDPDEVLAAQKAEEEKKAAEENFEDSQPLKGGKAAPAKDPKKMTVAEKKKAEEEAKKKAAEESVNSAEKQL